MSSPSSQNFISTMMVIAGEELLIFAPPSIDLTSAEFF
jgi:hypothetical protein